MKLTKQQVDLIHLSVVEYANKLAEEIQPTGDEKKVGTVMMLDAISSDLAQLSSIMEIHNMKAISINEVLL